MSKYSDLQKVLSELVIKKKWMVAVWIVEDGKIKMVDRITYQFPTDDFLVAIGQLANNCHEEKLACDKAEKFAAPKEELPSDPLPPVKAFKMPMTHGEAVAKQQELQREKDSIPVAEGSGEPMNPFKGTIEPTLPESETVAEGSTKEVPTNENGKTE